MTKVYKQILANNRFTNFATESAEFEHHFDITANNLNYQFKVNSEVKYNISLSLDELQAFNGFCSQNWIGFSGQLNHIPVSSENNVLNSECLVSLLDVTVDQKRSFLQTYNDAGLSFDIPVKFFVHSADDDFTKFDYSVQWPSEEFGDSEIENTITVTGDVELVATKKPWKEFFSSISVASDKQTYTAGEPIEVTVTASDTNLDYIYAESVVGVIDKTKIQLTNGVGSFSILTSSLSAGDTVEVKLGFKKYTNKTTFTKTLS